MKYLLLVVLLQPIPVFSARAAVVEYVFDIEYQIVNKAGRRETGTTEHKIC